MPPRVHADSVQIRISRLLRTWLARALPSLTCLGIFSAGPVWEKPSLFLGSLDIDGGLRQRFELGRLTGSPEFSLPIFLEHGFRAEDAVTEYKFPQLETYVAPEGRDQILWLEPGGIRHISKTKAMLTQAPAKQKEPWLAVKTGANRYEFRSNEHPPFTPLRSPQRRPQAPHLKSKFLAI